jgi:hypothetical protein
MLKPMDVLMRMRILTRMRVLNPIDATLMRMKAPWRMRQIVIFRWVTNQLTGNWSPKESAPLVSENEVFGVDQSVGSLFTMQGRSK